MNLKKNVNEIYEKFMQYIYTIVIRFGYLGPSCFLVKRNLQKRISEVVIIPRLNLHVSENISDTIMCFNVICWFVLCRWFEMLQIQIWNNCFVFFNVYVLQNSF